MTSDWITSELLEALSRAGVDTPATDARKLARWAFEQSGAPMGGEIDDTEARLRFNAAVLERAAGRPVSKIIGARAFWKHDFEVTDDVLDPRPDTETLIEAALAEPFESVLDMGTGSGCILGSLLAERPQALGVGTDISPEALAVARRNLERLGVADRAGLKLSDWFSDIGAKFDLIVSNPPYIAAHEMADLQREVRLFDPRMALTDEGDGLAAYRAIAAEAAEHLTAGGRLMVEIGWAQAADVAALFEAAGLLEVSVSKDLNQRDRVVVARSA